MVKCWGEEAIRLLLFEEYSDVNAGDEEVELLLARKGFNLNSKDKDGATPLRLAVRMNRTAIAKTLLTQSSLVRNSRNNSSKTPLYVAVFFEKKRNDRTVTRSKRRRSKRQTRDRLDATTSSDVLPEMSSHLAVENEIADIAMQFR
ncbi:hypothetical protein GGS21DRAFT_493801 [Xylaria nigripes]|nr:hypothetical protein GGS21DRAFT_493801 [Xylaria nigripes]